MSEHIVTRGCPDGYGYIRKVKRGDARYYPVELRNTSMGFMWVLGDNGFPRYTYGYENIVPMILRIIKEKEEE